MLRRLHSAASCKEMRKINEGEHEPITPKVLASSSPGLSFGNPGDQISDGVGTLKGFGSAEIQRDLANPFRVV